MGLVQAQRDAYGYRVEGHVVGATASVGFTNTASTTIALPASAPARVRLFCSANAWVRLGDAAVTVAGGSDAGAWLQPTQGGETLIVPPGVTHVAVRGLSGSGTLSVVEMLPLKL